MRVFWAIMEGRTDSNWHLNDLPGAGRMDEAARIVNAAFWLSHSIRADVTLYITFTGGQDAPKTLKFVGSELKKTPPDERGIAAIIRKALGTRAGDTWTRAHYGVYVTKKDIAEIQKEMPTPYILLDENGESGAGAVEEGATFIVGGPYGIPGIAMNKIKIDKRVRIGSRVYTASHTVCAVNLLLDGVCK